MNTPLAMTLYSDVKIEQLHMTLNGTLVHV
jgi:hypothetical protein